MVSLSLIENIENYLLHIEGEFSEQEISGSDTDFLFVKQFICDLVSGDNSYDNTRSVLNVLGVKVGENAGGFIGANGESCSDADLLLMVLENCNDEILSKLTAEFGEQSRISKLINEKVRRRCGTKKSERNIEQSIEKVLRENKNNSSNLYRLLGKYLERGGFKTDSSFYNYIGMSRQTFARIRDNSKSLSKQNILLIIVGLKLNYPEAVEFLQEFGYSFKNSDKRDAILKYILKNTDYDLDMVNDILYHFGAKTLIDS